MFFPTANLSGRQDQNRFQMLEKKRKNIQVSLVFAIRGSKWFFSLRETNLQGKKIGSCLSFMSFFQWWHLFFRVNFRKLNKRHIKRLKRLPEEKRVNLEIMIFRRSFFEIMLACNFYISEFCLAKIMASKSTPSESHWGFMMNTRVPFVYWKAPTLDVISFWLGAWTWDARALQDEM